MITIEYFVWFAKNVCHFRWTTSERRAYCKPCSNIFTIFDAVPPHYVVNNNIPIDVFSKEHESVDTVNVTFSEDLLGILGKK